MNRISSGFCQRRAEVVPSRCLSCSLNENVSSLLLPSLLWLPKAHNQRWDLGQKQAGKLRTLPSDSACSPQQSALFLMLHQSLKTIISHSWHVLDVYTQPGGSALGYVKATARYKYCTVCSPNWFSVCESHVLQLIASQFWHEDCTCSWQQG